MKSRLPGSAVAAGIIYFLSVFPLNGQQNAFARQVRNTYGPNQELVNGVQYYNPHTRVQNHPYFLADDFFSGSVTINGQEFSDVRIRYNLNTQQLELEYETFSEANNTLAIVSDHVEDFTLGDHRFMRLELEGEPRLYQVIETPQFTCYVHWDRELVQVGYSYYYEERYADAVRHYLMERNGEIKGFKKRKDFAACFPESYRKEINRYLRRRQFVFKEASPAVIARSMQEVSVLLNSDISP